MKSLILTEKPSQGKEMAAGLGADFKAANGYVENDTYVITWAIGHLVALSPPAAYNPEYEKYRREDLPIIPESFKYEIKEDTAAQFHIIKKLIHRNDIDKIIEAGDPGREGELISQLILLLAGNRKPVYRFWVTMALDKATIQQGMKNLKPADDYEGLYNSARVRAQCDWLIGMNASRAVSLKIGQACPIGRVQTPTLSLIVKRENEIKKFQPKDYWNIKGIFKTENGNYEGIWEMLPAAGDSDSEEDKNESKSRIFSRADAESIINKTKGQPGCIDKVITQKKSEKPPFLFNLTELQIQANKLCGASADETLKAAQELYEKDKALSYPRTESKHLSTNLIEEIPGIINYIKDVITFVPDKCSIEADNKRIFDNAKFTDHHALIPTASGKPTKDDSLKYKIYELVCSRFIAAFYPDFEYTTVTAFTKINNNIFKTTGKTVDHGGWREVYGGIPKDISLPPLQEGQDVDPLEINLISKKTTPPGRFNESEILKAMENISKYISEASYKKILRETSGLGTPATRAAILEALKKRYLSVQNKALVPNELAMKLIDILQEHRIADPLYTAWMEQELEEIAKEHKDPYNFINTVNHFIKDFITWTDTLDIRPLPAESKFKAIAKCPASGCTGNIMAYDKVFSCSEYKTTGCTSSLWRNSLEKLGKSKITDMEATNLFQGKTINLSLKSKAGKKYTATGQLEQAEKGYQIKIDFPKK